MGGMKKKPVGSSDKTAASDPTPDVKSTTEDIKKTGSKAQEKQKLSVFVEV